MWVADENEKEQKKKKKSTLLIDVVHNKNMEKSHQSISQLAGVFFQLI
jgi:hypothetical protein